MSSSLARSLNSLTNDCFSTPTFNMSAYKAASFAFWLYVPSGATGFALNLAGDYTAVVGSIYIYIPGNGTFELLSNAGSLAGQHFTAPSLDAWHRYLIQLDGSGSTPPIFQQSYVDGQPISYTDTDNIIGPYSLANDDFAVGGRASLTGFFLTCRMCDVTIWADPRTSGGPGPLLSQSDARTDYYHTINSVPSVQAPILRHFWPLNGTGATPEPDPVGNTQLSVSGSPQQIAGPAQPRIGPPHFLPEALGLNSLSGIR